MTRCPEFYDKLERDGNFCGLSPGAISQIKAYRELIDKIQKQGIDRTAAYEHFPAGAAREITAVKDDETRTKGLNYVISVLKEGKSVTAPELKTQIGNWLKSEGNACNLGHVSKKFTNVNSSSEKKPELTVEKPPFPVETVPYIPVHVPQDVPVPVRELPAPVPVADIEYEPHVVAPVTSPIPVKQKVSAQEFYAAELFKIWGKSLANALITIRSDQRNLSEGQILYEGVLALAEAKKKR